MFVVDDCMDAVLGDIQQSDNIMLCYSSVCHNDVMNLGSSFLCGDGDWPFRTGVVFQTLSVTFQFRSPLLHHAV